VRTFDACRAAGAGGEPADSDHFFSIILAKTW
jgi:hypothetical protein